MNFARPTKFFHFLFLSTIFFSCKVKASTENNLPEKLIGYFGYPEDNKSDFIKPLVHKPVRNLLTPFHQLKHYWYVCPQDHGIKKECSIQCLGKRLIIETDKDEWIVSVLQRKGSEREGTFKFVFLRTVSAGLLATLYKVFLDQHELRPLDKVISKNIYYNRPKNGEFLNDCFTNTRINFLRIANVNKTLEELMDPGTAKVMGIEWNEIYNFNAGNYYQIEEMQKFISLSQGCTGRLFTPAALRLKEAFIDNCGPSGIKLVFATESLSDLHAGSEQFFDLLVEAQDSSSNNKASI